MVFNVKIVRDKTIVLNQSIVNFVGNGNKMNVSINWLILHDYD